MASPLPPSSPSPQPAAEERSATTEVPDPVLGEEDFELELKRLAEEHQKLLAEMGLSQPANPTPAPKSTPAVRKSPSPTPADAARLERLCQENARLTARVAELEQRLRAAPQRPADDRTWIEREQEYEALLAEKSEAIRELRAELQEYKDRPQMVTPKEEEMVALSEHLENDRKLLEEDERALEEQAKQMELNIARQRADVARQRIEVERMFADLQLELDQAMRESGLRIRLAPLQRRSQEYAIRTGQTPV